MRDDLEVRIERLKNASRAWHEDADDLRAPLDNSDWNPFDVRTSPAMPGGLKILIEDLQTATLRLRNSLRGGVNACERAAAAVGVAAGMYEEVEQESEQQISTMGATPV